MKCLAGIALGVTLVGAVGAGESPSRVVDQGVAIDFSASTPQRAGDPVTFRFDVHDTASDAPIGGLRPAAWLARRDANDAAPECARKVATYLGGDLFDRADVDLTTYFVLSLDDGPTISVVDPLFGFGGSKLLTMLPLMSRGADWALDDAQHRLFVSMPAVGKVAVADTRTWRIVGHVATGSDPRGVVLASSRAWIADDGGVTAIDTTTLATTSVRSGRSSTVVASDDGDFVFATSGRNVVIIDAHSAHTLARIAVDGTPTLLAYSSAARAVYAVDAHAGRVFAIDARRGRIVATTEIRAGATQIRFAPGGRLALIPNPVENVVQVLDAATNRVVQTAAIDAGPDRVSYTPLLAYVRRRGSEIVAMIPLDQLGTEGKSIGVADFPGGQHAFGDGPASLADTIVPAPDGPAVLVANGADRMIYLYKEGMAAPAGGFSTYGRPPRAVLVVDHGLREQQRGRYATTVPVPEPGTYDVVLFVDAPRIVACFATTIGGAADTLQRAVARVTAIDPPKRLVVGRAAHLRFAVNGADGSALRPVDDMRALAFEAPGVWQQRTDVNRLADGHYAVDFVPPEAGIYYVWIESESLGLARNNSQFHIYEAN